MAYLNYNRSLYRTGFRPYGQTNPWAASQLNGLSVSDAALSGYLGQNHPFTDAGGWRLHGVGQARAFSPWVLRGLGDAPVCLDQAENPVACQDPECTYGDCGAVSTGSLPSGSCLNFQENQVLCTDPNCRYGDCLDTAKSGKITLPPGPANRVGVPVSQFPPTSPQAPVQQAQPAWMKGTIIKGVPDILLYGFAALAAISFIAPASGGRRR